MARNTATQKRLREQLRAKRLPCHICGFPIDYSTRGEATSFEMDHVVPLAKGGKDAVENVRAAHKACNRSKGARVVPKIIRRSGSFQVPDGL